MDRIKEFLSKLAFWKKKEASKSNSVSTDTEKKKPQDKKEKPTLKTWAKVTWLVVLWLGILSPWIVLYFALNWAEADGLPSYRELENPTSNEASTVITADGLEIGKYFLENRTPVTYNKISPYVVDALVSTEDERFYEHYGVDVYSLPRVFSGMMSGNQSKGGGSTISQQLAKMLFPREKLDTKSKLIKRKLKEWMLSTRLENKYTKQEIVTMYLNKFDFLNNAVGIHSAAKVYFNTTPDSLKMEEAAMLVGMAKNPSIFNPLKNYDTTLHRRNVVINQWLKNSNRKEAVLSKRINKQIADSLKKLPITLDFRKVDHQDGPAPYFREMVRKEVSKLLATRKNGQLVYKKKNGDPYNIYMDGLKIYTTVDSKMQEYAEYAVEEWLGGFLQEKFEEQAKRKLKDEFPFDFKAEQIYDKEKREDKIEETIIRGIKQSDRYKGMKLSGKSQKEIMRSFNKKIPMKVFSWKGEIDTLMSPKDSVRYYKSILRAGLMSVDPHTGFVRAYVGGPNFYHFKYDHVSMGKRQVGSTFKPFVYASALKLHKIEPCLEIPHLEYCVPLPHNRFRDKMWCPKNSGGGNYDAEPISMKYGLAGSINSVTAYVMREVGPKNVVNFVDALGINTDDLEPVPALALGICALSVWEMTGAQSAFVNKGVHIEPIIISRIEDKNGNIIYEAMPQMTEAFDEDVAYATLELMKGVMSGAYRPATKSTAGTAAGLRIYNEKSRPWGGIRVPMAGKTGTTQKGSDGWFMGLTPDLVTGVWVGGEDQTVHFPTIQYGQGGRMALPIYGYYMKKVYEDKRLNISQKDFEKPLKKSSFEFDCSVFKQQNDGVDDPGGWDFNE